MQIGKATELTILEYAASLDLNPENVFYQRIRANSASTSNVQWSIITPDVRSLLLAYGQIDWSFTLTRQTEAGVAENFVSSTDGTSFKPIMPFTNAMTSQTVSLNGNSITMSQPRNFIENLSRLNVSKAESQACYETQWWDGSGGNQGAGRGGMPFVASERDHGLVNNEKYFRAKLVELNPGVALPSTLVGQSAYPLVRLQEPLLCPPFNPYGKVQSGMADYMPFKWMSPVIPNIKQIQVSIQFNAARLAASLLYYRYSRSAVNDQVNQWEITNLQADLLFYWYQVPTGMSIPRSPVLQTWNMTEYQNAVGAAGAVANSADGPRTNSPLIQLESVPGFFIIHARRRQDDALYRAVSHGADTDGLGSNPGGAYGADGAAQAPALGHSFDTHLEIRDLRIQLGSRPDAISTAFSQRELYDITLKNSKYAGFSLDFNSWKGPIVNYKRFADGVAAATEVVANGLVMEPQASKSFVCVQPKDVAQRISGGVRFPNSLLVQANLRGRDGCCGMRGADLNYDLFVHVFINKHWIRIEPDRAQYEEQSLTLDAAERMIAAGSATAGSLRPGTGGYVAKF